MKKLDLHCHTTCSDGTFSPQKIIDTAVKRGLSTLAICDHDCVQSYSQLDLNKIKILHNLQIVTGVELSISYHGGTFHLLGLGIDIQSGDFKAIIEKQKKFRAIRMLEVIDRLKDCGMELSLTDLQQELDSENALGRPHVARAMIRKGYSKDLDDAFDNYLLKGKPGYVSKKKIEAEEGIKAIIAAGGIPIIAHPASLNLEIADFEKKLDLWQEMGVQGIEVYSNKHDDTLVAAYSELAEKHHLLLSGGSDFHGDRGAPLGEYGEERFIPEDKLQPLLEKIIKQ